MGNRRGKSSSPEPADEDKSGDDALDEGSTSREGAGEPSLTEAEPTSTVYEFKYETREPIRLDQFLCTQLPGRTRAFIQRLIEEGYVTLDPPREAKPAFKLRAGVCVRVTVPPPRKVDLSPQDIPIGILYEDNNMAVVVKPTGLAVHPAPDQTGHTLVNALLFHLKNLSGIGGEERPGIVHRLDKETSGILLIAKNDFAHQALACQFKERTVHKTYIAISRGEPTAWEGAIDYNLGRSYTHAKKQMIRVDGTGRTALTHFRLLEKYRGYALVELYPQTGRTHQIRVHLASQRLPVACDKLYGREKRIYLSELKETARERDEEPILERHALHAAAISFRHPLTREEMTFQAPLPPDMDRLRRELERHRSPR